MAEGYFIRENDRTTCGGIVLDSNSTVVMHGEAHVLEGARVTCGVDGKVYEIEGGISFIRSQGKRVAGTLDSFSTCPCRAEFHAASHKGSYHKAITNADRQTENTDTPGARRRPPSLPILPALPETNRRSHSADVPEETEEEEEEVELEQVITLRVGMFFDGTGNNRTNSELAFRCFARDLGLEDAAEDIRRFCEMQGYDGHGGAPDDSRGNDSSNVAKLYDLYQNDSERRLPDDETEASLRVYVEGIGTSSTAGDSRFSQGTGLGAQGVRSRVEQSPALLLKTLKTFQENNPDKRIKQIEFDVFGFSRGAAAARDFANEVLKGERGIVAKALPAGTPGLDENFAWRHNTDFCINYIGIIDTVAAIAAHLHGDFSGNNANNPGINIRLAPDAAKKIVHLVAQDERRYNFSLNQAGSADIVLPGVHSDLGGGYRPDVTERVLLSRPQFSDIDLASAISTAPSYQRAMTDLLRLQKQYAKYGLSLRVRTWESEVTVRAKGDLQRAKRIYAAVSSERTVHNDLALVYLRVMRELAVQNGVPFQEIPTKNRRLALPEELLPVAEKLINYALGKTSAYGLTANEEALIYRRYVHISSHWNPVNDWISGIETVFINRPGDSDLRTVHPND
jgi:type VI secretion system secreted protein VgrG